MKLTGEQEAIIKAAKEGKDIFVDACIGSGKTTTINEICQRLEGKILYLTYNKLLKEDAKKKIRTRNTEVTNYHGFVYKYLSAYRLPYSHQNGIKDFIRYVQNETIKMSRYDTVIVDEYQDINDDAARLLETIDTYQEEAQFIFVGDMKQKIYDTSRVNPIEFIFSLGRKFEAMDLTHCFRLNKTHAEMLRKIWKKEIKGVNEKQIVSHIRYDQDELYDIISEYENKDILILTPFRNNVKLNQFINFIEKIDNVKYNKKNLYVTTSDRENTMRPVEDSMIVTTFDGSKGLERRIAIVFGFETDALAFRSEKGNKEIIKNLFLVAASRGKDEIIFIEEKTLLNEENFNTYLMERKEKEKFAPSSMFDFCFDTDIQETFEMLEIKEEKTEDKTEIKAILNDYNINLAPVIGLYQEAIFFKDWNYEKILNSYPEEKPIVKYIKKIKPKTTRKKILSLASIETDLARYHSQSIEEFIEIDEEVSLLNRLKERLEPELPSQIKVEYKAERGVSLIGYIDTVKEGVPYELKFVDHLEYKHFLQLGTYLMMGEFEKGVLWNTRKNEVFEVRIKDKEEFKKRMIKTIKK